MPKSIYLRKALKDGGRALAHGLFCIRFLVQEKEGRKGRREITAALRLKFSGEPYVSPPRSAWPLSLR